MCFATAASAALSVAGTAASTMGALSAGQSGNASAQYRAGAQNYQAQVNRNQAQVMENNAIIAEQKADYAGKVGLIRSSTESMKGAAKMAKIKTGIAANNIDPNSGSAVDVRQSQSEINKLDAETVLSDAELRAYGYNLEATNDRYEAENLRAGGALYDTAARFSRAEGEDAITGSYFKAGGTILSGLSSLPFGKLGDVFKGSGGGAQNRGAIYNGPI